MNVPYEAYHVAGSCLLEALGWYQSDHQHPVLQQQLLLQSHVYMYFEVMLLCQYGMILLA